MATKKKGINSRELAKVLNDAEYNCLEAVDYVGSANYPSRERQAKIWVEQSFELLTKAIHQHRVYLKEKMKG